MPVTLTINDRASFAVTTKRTYTDEGFLKVPGRVARTGVQEYLASELGITDRNPNDIIKVHRPDDSVFDEASLASYNGADVTIEHPSEMVNVDSYNGVTAGVVVGSATRDGDFVSADMIIKSRDAIKAVESGKVQLSAGYTAIYDEAPEDSPYDFIQREIRVNHVALVDRARAGAQARLFDNKPGALNMPVNITLDSGRSVDVADAANATLVAEAFDTLKNKLSLAELAVVDAKAETEKMEAKKDTAEEDLEEEKKKSSDSAIAERVESIASTMDNARKLAGAKFSCDSVSLIDIQRAALDTVRPNTDWADKSDVYVQAAFDGALETADADPAPVNDQLRQFAKDAAAPIVTEIKQSAYDSHKSALSEAWKGE